MCFLLDDEDRAHERRAVEGINGIRDHHRGELSGTDLARFSLIIAGIRSVEHIFGPPGAAASSDTSAAA